jgi:hypothetical protein
MKRNAYHLCLTWPPAGLAGPFAWAVAFSSALKGRNAVTAIRGLTGEQINALEMLAGCPDGCTESELKAKGFTIGLLGGLIRAGLATATPGVVKAGDRTLGVVRLAITEKGRTMIVR